MSFQFNISDIRGDTNHLFTNSQIVTLREFGKTFTSVSIRLCFTFNVDFIQGFTLNKYISMNGGLSKSRPIKELCQLDLVL